MPAMFQLSRTLRRVFALLTAAVLLWSAGAEACSDWIEHERSHAAALGEAGNGDPSAPAAPAGHDKACHACHHLQAHLAPVVLVPAIAAALPRSAPPATASHDSTPDLPYHPPRSTTLA
jgi:cytochrome c5